MRKGILAVSFLVGALPGTLPASTLQIVPTTTLQAQTGGDQRQQSEYALSAVPGQPHKNLCAPHALVW